jgi:glycosyltransferase involved in cell wall biosynthesis
MSKQKLALPTKTASPHLDSLNHELDRIAWLGTELKELDGPDTGILPFTLPKNFLLSVVIPVFNERRTLEELVERVLALPLPLQIILVDDCSTDGTREVLQRLESRGNVEAVYQATNQGKGAALRAGFKRARGDVVAIQDADLEYEPRDLPRLLEPIVIGTAEVVFGSRFTSAAANRSSAFHRFGNRLLTRASNLTTGLRITDMETCYKLFRRDVLQRVEIRQNRFGFEPEITAKIARHGYRVEELPIQYYPRSWRDGKKIGLRDALNAFYCIVRYAWAD